MTIMSHLDKKAPKYRIIEGRFHNNVQMAHEILDTQIMWAETHDEMLHLIEQYRELWSDEAACDEFLATITDMDPRVMGNDEGDFVVGTTPILPDPAEQQEFIWGYIKASMFAALVIVVHKGGDEVLETVSPWDLGYSYHHDLPTGVYNDLVAEAEWILECLEGDLVVAVHLRNWIETTKHNTLIATKAGLKLPELYLWTDAGEDALLTKERHGTGYWDREMPDESGDVLTEWAHLLGSGGYWEYVIDADVEWNIHNFPDGELIYQAFL